MSRELCNEGIYTTRVAFGTSLVVYLHEAEIEKEEVPDS